MTKSTPVIRGNDNYFGHCPVPGHENYYLNIGRSHWMVCDECKIKWLMGENLFSSWREESEALWKANAERIGNYKEVDIGALRVLISKKHGAR